MVRKFLSLSLLMLALVACTDSPRNHQPLAHASDPITWAGRDVSPNVDYLLMIGDGSQAPTTADIITSAKTAATPSVTDDVGRNWYGWSKELTLPGDPRLWKVVAPHKMEATMRTMPYAGMFDATRRTPLASFDYGTATDTCISNHRSGGGEAIVNNCKSAAAGVVKVEAPCGTKNESCCPVSANWMTDPASCDSGLACTSSGGLGICRVPLGGACTTLSDCVYNANACVSGVCRHLNALGESCSTLSDCNASATSCTSGRCSVANGTPCTANNQCASNNCKAGICSIVCTQNAACTVPNTQGPCSAGKWACTTTTKTCNQVVFSSPETCDNKDNDCDGTKDEGNPGGGTSCGTNTGECSTGTNQCQNGALRCVGAVTATTEVCDSRDNNCNGSTDENNVCAPPCGANLQPCCSGNSCNSGLYCGDTGFCGANPPGPCNYLGEACCMGTTTSSSSCSNTYDSRLQTSCIGSCNY